jgi:hypothetical protein
MKRLIILAVILVPGTYHALRYMAASSCCMDESSAELRFEPPAPRAPSLPPRHVREAARSHVRLAMQTIRRALPAVTAGAGAVANSADESSSLRVILSDYMATPERARHDARTKLDRAVGDWLAGAGVPRTWTAPRALVDRLVRGEARRDVDRGYAVVYLDEISAEFSPRTQAPFVQAYDREIGGKRLVVIGAVILLLLVGLAAFSGYVRADEATKGYYTNRLRIAALAGMGAAGYAAYRVLVS